MLKSFIKKNLPPSVLKILKKYQNRIALVKGSIIDFRRYKKYCLWINEDPTTYENLRALIIKNYHSIEKGLSYEEIRNGFGSEPINQLIKLLELYTLKKYPKTDINFLTAVSVLKKYIEHHEANLYDVKDLKTRVNNLKIQDEDDLGGVKHVTKEEILASVNLDFHTFSKNRYSIREFSKEDVDINLIYKAIEIAIKTPSACNRQPWKVKIVKDSEQKKIICMNQNGNKGFGHNINTFLIVTSDNNSYIGARERNQPFIDGGMFAMSLIYALHYVGLATCPLSAALSIKQETNLRTHLKINDSEVFTLIIGVGHYVDSFKVTKSRRDSVEKFVYKH